MSASESSAASASPSTEKLRAASAWAVPALVVGATAVGFLIRLLNFDQSLIGDELSTYWIVHGRSLKEVLDLVHSDAEITPPVYFVLAWLTSKLGSDPMWVKFPSLIAGTASIPLIYYLGARTIGKMAGAVGSVLFALSPFMIYYSTEARAYSVMILLIICSTIALVVACESGRKRWWATYAACICLAMLSHYTAVFYLVAQFGWALWAHPTARKGLIIASAVAIVAYLPWLSGFIADNNSPTTELLNALQPFNFGAVRFATEQWAVGFPYLTLRSFPGALVLILIVVGVVIAVAGVTARTWKKVRAARGGGSRSWWRIPPGLTLVLLLALATPVGELLLSPVGTNLYGARNLNAASPGLALVGGAAVVGAGALAGVLAAVILIVGFGISGFRTLEPKYGRDDYRGVAEFISGIKKPRDVVIDGATGTGLTPVPTTGLDVFYPGGPEEYRLNLPTTNMPFTIFDAVPSSVAATKAAFADANNKRGRIIYVQLDPTDGLAQVVSGNLDPEAPIVSKILKQPPYGYRLVERKLFPGIPNVSVLVLAP